MKFRAIVISLLALSGATTFAHAEKLSDASIKRLIIQDSLASYPGPCPCPYNLARNGSRCGGRSAYSRPGGYAPICYDAQVTREMIDSYRHEHGG